MIDLEIFSSKNKMKNYEEKIEERLWDDELTFEEAAFLMGYNDFA